MISTEQNLDILNSKSPFRFLFLGLRGLKDFLSKTPFSISFEITHVCNAKCLHCHLGGAVKEERASPQVYAEICRKVKPVIAQFSGGEPLLRQDLEEIVRAVRVPNGSPFIVITTNGVLLTRKRYDQLRAAGVDEFSISLDYPDERHDTFRQVPGLFQRIKNLIEGLDSVKDKGITLCCVVQRDNFRELPRMAELAREWKVNINFSTYTPLRTRDEGYMISKEELGEFKEVIRKLIAFRKKYRTIFSSAYVFKNMVKYFEWGYFPRCRTGEKFCNVNPDGTFSPCGLIIKDYKSLGELKNRFSRTNNCIYCLTSIRANCEKPGWRLVWDTLKSI